jgi:hypothetical protein
MRLAGGIGVRVQGMALRLTRYSFDQKKIKCKIVRTFEGKVSVLAEIADGMAMGMRL